MNGKITREQLNPGLNSELDEINTQLSENTQQVSDLDTKKADKVPGKGLSTNDYTDNEKSQVATNKNDIDTQKTRIDLLVQTPNSSFYQKKVQVERQVHY